MKKYLLVAIIAMVASQGLVAQSPWTDAAEERKIDSILTRMTLEEKIGQMTLFTSDWDQTGPTLRAGYRDDVRAGRVGAIFNAHTAAYNRELQRMSIEETRMGIPLLFGYDVIHGYRTIFPIPLGEAASWNLPAIENAARIAAAEASAAGLHWTFAPMVDIARDPRWGRVMEGSGEDVYLGTEIAKARVQGFQGKDLADPTTILACAKHYAAYGAAQAGRDYHTVDISERTLRETYLPPFKAAADLGVATFMTSFNEVDGIPASGNKHLLTDILRDEWGFDGFVVTDYTSINEMVKHGNVADLPAAGLLALKAGVDMDMQGAVYHEFLAGQVRRGEISETYVNEAVRRVLRLKFALGLFEDPYRYSDEAREKRVVFSAENRAAAREMARQSIVLLKNDKQTLPLSKDIRSMALIGPLADAQSDMLGAWHADGRAADCITLRTGLEQELGKSVRINYTKGCEVEGDDRSGFAAAVRLAKQSDVVVVAVGERDWMSGEAASRTDITLPGVQSQLVQTLVATGKPVVVVLMNGRPLAIPEIDKTAPAILETWFLGTEAGPAIADVLFGDYNPSGKLPMTFPRHVGQVPIHYDMKNTGRPMNPTDKYTSKYLDMPNTPLYPFGYGLSYTTFGYDELRVSSPTMPANGSVTVTVNVKNTGKIAGTEVVQLYVRDVVGSVTRPVRMLKGFERVTLAAGQQQTVSFTLTEADLAFQTAENILRAEPGRFEVFVGGDSTAAMMVTFDLVD
jgi:beta-glucosidase